MPNVKLLDVKDETHDVKTFVLEKPPGFEYKPGQYVMLMLDGDDRMFTLSSSPTERHLFISIKMTGSEFKKKFAGMKGAQVSISNPMGQFVLEEGKKVMIAGGIGVTPFRSMLKFAADKGLKDDVVLIYSNKTPADIAFHKEFEEIQKHGNIRIINTITRPEGTEWSGRTGRVDEKMLAEFGDFKKDTFYVCGPPAMVDATIALLKAAGAQKIKLERFTGY